MIGLFYLWPIVTSIMPFKLFILFESTKINTSSLQIDNKNDKVQPDKLINAKNFHWEHQWLVMAINWNWLHCFFKLISKQQLPTVEDNLLQCCKNPANSLLVLSPNPVWSCFTFHKLKTESRRHTFTKLSLLQGCPWAFWEALLNQKVAMQRKLVFITLQSEVSRKIILLYTVYIILRWTKFKVSNWRAVIWL